MSKRIKKEQDDNLREELYVLLRDASRSLDKPFELPRLIEEISITVGLSQRRITRLFGRVSRLVRLSHPPVIRQNAAVVTDEGVGVISKMTKRKITVMVNGKYKDMDRNKLIACKASFIPVDMLPKVERSREEIIVPESLLKSYENEYVKESG